MSQITKEVVEKFILQEIQDYFGYPLLEYMDNENLNKDNLFSDDFNHHNFPLDSLDILELAMELELEYGISIDDEVLEDLTDLNELVKVVIDRINY